MWFEVECYKQATICTWKEGFIKESYSPMDKTMDY